MKKGKQDIYFAFPAYGGNGGISMLHPTILEWFVGVMLKVKSDPRIGEVYTKIYSDTPITMMRNRMVTDAREAGADILIMVDSDMYPDIHVNEPHSKPFWDSSLDFVLNHMDKGPCLVAAPYAGPPPHECVYAFQWGRNSSTGAFCDLTLKKYDREHALMLAGIQPAAAVATGLIIYDMRVFELTEPQPGKPNSQQTGWFYYEYTDHFARDKASTEDVTATRDISMAGHQLLGYSPVFVNWDAWAGHWKPYPVPKPVLPTVEMVGEVFERAIRTGRRSLNDHLRLVGDGKQPAEDEKVWGLPHVNEEARTVIDRYSCMYTDTFSHAELTNMLNQKHGHPADIKVVEIGSFIGDMAKRIAAWCPDAKIWCVDPWVGGYDGTDVVSDVYSRYSPDGVYNAFLLNTEAYRDRVTPLRMTSLEAAKKFEDGSLDCVYIDGEHTAAAVTADIEAWLPKVKPGGLLCGDDYGRHSCPEVKGAVDQALGKVENACFMWYIEKPAVKDEVRKNGHAPKNRIKKALKRAT